MTCFLISLKFKHLDMRDLSTSFAVDQFIMNRLILLSICFQAGRRIIEGEDYFRNRMINQIKLDHTIKNIVAGIGHRNHTILSALFIYLDIILFYIFIYSIYYPVSLVLGQDSLLFNCLH